MAIPAIPALGKGLLAALKASKLMKAVNAGATLSNAARAAKAAGGSAARFAGDKGAALGSRFANQFQNLSAKEAAMLFGPDVVFGGIAGVITPGDLGDKAMAGLGSAAGGVVGGAAGRSLLKPGKPIGIGGYAADMIGSAGGDMVGYEAANAGIRARHGGLTPAELEALEYEEQMKQQAIQNYLATGRY